MELGAVILADLILIRNKIRFLLEENFLLWGIYE